MKKVLIVGTGGREHAISKALQRSTHNPEIYAIGGWANPGIQHVDIIDINDPHSVVEYAQEKEIDTVIIGSENQLEQGLTDQLNQADIFCVGPTKELAMLETDKVYARSVIDNAYNPRYKVFYDTDYSYTKLCEWIEELGGDYVIKAVGLCGGKGVKVSDVHISSIQEADEYCRELLAHDSKVLVEERLFGEEFTILAFADGECLVNMPVVKDFKRLNDGDCGPNTGGMGCVSFAGGSAPFLTDQDLNTARTINRLVLDKLPGYTGILYGSFMKTNDGVKVIEYNCRFGDPEAINVLELLETDFVDILDAMKTGTLNELNVEWSSDAMVTNYIVAPGYPETPKNANIKMPFSNNIIYAKIVKGSSGEYTQLASRSFAFWSRGTSLKLAYSRNSKLLKLVESLDCSFRTDLGKQWIS